jgi:hypothetical protein
VKKKENKRRMIYALFVLLGVLSSVMALPQRHQGKMIYDNGMTVENSLYLKKIDLAGQLYVNQSLDHFDRQESRTFQQRYFVSDTYWKKDDVNAPVFLCVGGEGPPLDRTVLTSSVHCSDMVELASQVGALMFALEHRYYGFSNPFGSDFSTANLQWLNTEQALGDLAHFIATMNEQYNLQKSNRWVTWGGSYPGMLAGLTRLRYPHLVHAAVSSSAPLQPSVDMPGYNNVVSHSMAATDVGGSAECLAVIVEGHKVIGELLTSDIGRRKVEKTFNVCVPRGLENVKNQEEFAGDGVVYFPVQSNDPSCTTPYCNIASICTELTKPDADGNTDILKNPMERLASLSAAMRNNKCVTVNADASASFWAASNNPDRSWLYQTCTEWGFYQTCSTDSRCPYTQGLHNIQSDLDLCESAFGIKSEDVYAQITNTQAIYGGRDIQGSRIFFVNGEIDPWHANSVLVPPNLQEPTLWVKGASHHFWTHPSLPTDAPEINEARQKIWSQVKSWLNV